MDPKACLQELIEAIIEGEAFIARERYASYIYWRAHGGFEPVMSDGVNGDNYAFLLRKQYAETFGGSIN